jgi:hypothetical protein
MNINDAFPSRYLKAADLKDRPPVVVTIKSITMEEMPEGENRPVAWFEGKEKGVVLNKTNASMIAHSYSPETDNWIGKKILLRCEPVPFAGRIVDSIRVAVANAEQYAAEQAATEANLKQEGESAYPDEDFSDEIPF